MYDENENERGQSAYSEALAQAAREGYQDAFQTAYADALMTERGWQHSSLHGWSR